MIFELAALRNLHFTMAKPWDLRHPCHKGFEQLNQLWHAAYAEPRTLSRTLLQAHLAEKRARRAAEPGNSRGLRLERFVVYAVTGARRFVSLIPKVRSPSTHRRERKASPLLLICGAYLYYTCRTLRCWAAACC
eukprot:scaffold70396_cov69-Phaeocystis_antarctica.AAC.1